MLLHYAETQYCQDAAIQMSFGIPVFSILGWRTVAIVHDKYQNDDDDTFRTLNVLVILYSSWRSFVVVITWQTDEVKRILKID